MIGFGGQRILEIYAPESDPDDIKAAEKTVDLLVKAPINENQRDALISHCESIGPDEFKICDLLKAINRKKTLAGVMKCAPLFIDYLKDWDDKGRMRESKILISRRNEEMALFYAPVLKIVGGKDKCQG